MATSNAGRDRSAQESTSPKGKAKKHAKQAAAEAKDKAGSLADQAKVKAKEQARAGKRQAADTLDDVAYALDETADAFRERNDDAFARYATAASDQVSDLVASIRTRNVGDLLDEAERFARRDPALFLGGAFLLGIAGARFLKASQGGQGRGDGFSRSGGRPGGPADTQPLAARRSRYGDRSQGEQAYGDRARGDRAYAERAHEERAARDHRLPAPGATTAATDGGTALTTEHS